MSTYVMVRRNSEGQIQEALGPVSTQECHMLHQVDPQIESVDELLFSVLFPDHYQVLLDDNPQDAVMLWIEEIDNTERIMYSSNGYVFNKNWVIELTAEEIILWIYDNCAAVESAKITNCLKDHFPSVPLLIRSLNRYYHYDTSEELN